MSKLPVPVTNVTVLTPEYGGWSVSADYLDAHYHYWVAAGDETLTPRDNVLYRRPAGLREVSKRKIDRNLSLVDAMRATAISTNAVAVGRQQAAKAEDDRLTVARASAQAATLDYVRELASDLGSPLYDDEAMPDDVLLRMLLRAFKDARAHHEAHASAGDESARESASIA